MHRNGKFLLITIGILSMIFGFAPQGMVPFMSLACGNSQPSGNAQTSAMSPGRELLEQFSAAFEDVAAKVNPSVVPIFSEQVVESESPFNTPDDPFRQLFGDDFFKRFFGTPPQGEEKQTVHSLGSGVIVSSDGYILTNNHVVEGSEKLTVVFQDKKKYTAKIIGTDPQTDVAVIKVDATGLPAVSFGNSENVRVGQWVIAIGNPFQLMHTVTAGIISAKGRSSVGLADYEDFIQTDASINPGNSGGALADLDGNVIGINTAISSPSGGNVGIGFAIPINMARRVMDELLTKGKITRGYLALVPQDIDDNLAKALKLKSTEGALVGDVTSGGPADKAGIKRGDIIKEFKGEKVLNSTSLRNMVAQAEPGSSANIKLLRNATELQVVVVLGERPSERSAKAPEKEEQPKEQSYKKLGLSVQTLTPDIAQQLGYQNDHGVVIADIAAGSAAEDAGLQRGDLIKEVNKVRISTVRELSYALSRLGSGDSAAFLIRRDQNTFYVAIQMP